MRILFTFVGGRGHFEPLVPIARAAADAGHTVAVGCAPSLVGTVSGEGFPTFPLGRMSDRPRERIPLRPVDREREDRDLRERFVRRAARYRVPHIIGLCDDWQPDILVCDETDFGALLAAETVGLPFATVQVTATGSFVRREVVGEALEELRAEHCLEPDPALSMCSRYLVLSPFPSSLRDPAHPLPATGHGFRPLAPEPASGAAPDWCSTLPGAPGVYFTLGTIFNTESGDLFGRVLSGLRELHVNLIVTTGDDIAPRELGPQPSNVRIERYVPQASVLPHCALVVSHGGSGSVVGALAHGLPSVLIPMGADQPLNAERCADLGVALVLDAFETTPEDVRSAAASVLDDSRYRLAAERLRDEIAALPHPARAVKLLERLAEERQPLYRV